MIPASSKDISFASTSSGMSKDSQTVVLSAPMVTALSWSVVDTQTGELLWGKDANERMEIASLTKVMTAYATLRILRLLKLDYTKTSFEVSHKAVLAIGTSAGLVEGDKMKVLYLLHGLLLPSGNDAAIVLAEGCGKQMIEAWGRSKVLKRKLKKFLCMASAKEISAVDPAELFVRGMNRLATKLGLSKSTFSNPNGLADKANKSTAADLGRLVHFAKKEPEIELIVKTREFKCVGTGKKGEQRIYGWTNTNVLLKEGYDGFKTGITPTAGPCLIATRTYRGISLAIVVLHCKTCEHRWKEVNAIHSWASMVIDSIYANNPEENIKLKKLQLLFHKAL